MIKEQFTTQMLYPNESCPAKVGHNRGRKEQQMHGQKGFDTPGKFAGDAMQENRSINARSEKGKVGTDTKKEVKTISRTR